jgi:glucose-1-phosphate adenylyltransferase
VLSGDQLYEIDFHAMITKHVESGVDLTIATIPVSAKDAPGFGILKADSYNRITSFIEKPAADKLPGWESTVTAELEAQGRVYLASMGIYIFNKSVIKEVLHANLHHDFGKEVIPEAIKDQRSVASYPFTGYWTDIGNIDSFFEANIGLTDDIPKLNLFHNDTIFTRPRMLPPSKFFGTTLDHVLMAEGCIVRAAIISRSVIGIRARIGRGTEIHNSYVMGCDYYQTLQESEDLRQRNMPAVGIGDNCFITRAIIDKNCCIGNNVRIDGSKLPDGDYETYFVKDHIVVVKKYCTIENNTVIE